MAPPPKQGGQARHQPWKTILLAEDAAAADPAPLEVLCAGLCHLQATPEVTETPWWLQSGLPLQEAAFAAIAEFLEKLLWRTVAVTDVPSPPRLRRARSGLKSCTEEHDLQLALQGLLQGTASMQELSKGLGDRTFGRLLQTWQHEYFKLCRARFEKLGICSFYWDPGCHSGRDYMVTVGAGLLEDGNFVVGYAPMVQLKKLKHIHLQLDDAILQHIATAGPERMAALEQLVALDMGMQWSFSCRLQDFLP